MKKIFLKLTSSFAGSIDSGSFFRKPFGWLYTVIAIVSLAVPIYFIYAAVNLHAAYDRVEKHKMELARITPKYEAILAKYETAYRTLDKLNDEMENALSNYKRSENNANSYYSYTYYGMQNYYTDAKRQASKYLAEYKSLEKKHKTAETTFEKISPEYEKIKKEYDGIAYEYGIATTHYYNIAPSGAFHNTTNELSAISALLIFVLVSLFWGIFNFKIWWDRKQKVNFSSSDNDEFTAVPAFAHYIQTLGESMGIYISIMGFFIAFNAIIFKVCFGTYGLSKLYIMNLEFASDSIPSAIPALTFPLIAGFTAIILLRVIAESMKALVVIANNTRGQKSL